MRLTCWSYIAAPDWLARERARPTLLIFTHKHIDRDWNVIHGMASGYKYGTGLWHTRLKAKMPKSSRDGIEHQAPTTALQPPQKRIGNTIFLRCPKRRDCGKNIQHFCSWLLKKDFVDFNNDLSCGIICTKSLESGDVFPTPRKKS